jgi:hypothetical protein
MLITVYEILKKLPRASLVYITKLYTYAIRFGYFPEPR